MSEQPKKKLRYSETNLLTTVVKWTIKPCSRGNLNSTRSQGIITWGAHILLAKTLYSLTHNLPPATFTHEWKASAPKMKHLA